MRNDRFCGISTYQIIVLVVAVDSWKLTVRRKSSIQLIFFDELTFESQAIDSE